MRGRCAPISCEHAVAVSVQGNHLNVSCAGTEFSYITSICPNGNLSNGAASQSPATSPPAATAASAAGTLTPSSAATSPPAQNASSSGTGWHCNLLLAMVTNRNQHRPTRVTLASNALCVGHLHAWHLISQLNCKDVGPADRKFARQHELLGLPSPYTCMLHLSLRGAPAGIVEVPTASQTTAPTPPTTVQAQTSDNQAPSASK